MKKRVSIILFTLLLTVVGSFLILYFKPSFVFIQTENKAWNIARSVIFSGMVVMILEGLYFIVKKRNDIVPYVQKFRKFTPLLYQLVRRDFLAKYKRSVLGVLWSLLSPLLTMIILTIVFSTLFRFDIENYPVYLLSGNIIFTMFNEITNTCLYSVIGASALMKKVSVPKYIFPFSRALSALINFVFSFISLLFVMWFTGSTFHLSMLFIPISIFYVFVFATGIGLILSTAMVFFRDVSYLYGIFITAITYFTPLFYPIGIIPISFRWIISLNPLYHFVECFRTCSIYGSVPSVWQNLICFILASLSLAFGLWIFNKKQDDFILFI